MKKTLVAALLAMTVMAAPARGAEWKEGLGPQKPYTGLMEVDLSASMGYIILYPRDKMPAPHFCDVLELYLPREDLAPGEGQIHLYDESGLLYSASCNNAQEVSFRTLSEDELDGLMWGSGTCITVALPVSLTIGGAYYVQMDEGCFTAADGKVISLPITSKTAWVPVVSGDYGVSRLFYQSAGSGQGEDAAAGTSREEDAAAGQATLTPAVGDTLSFDVLIGGDAVSAVVYSENASVEFPELEFTASGTVTGQIVREEISWGIVFLNADGDVLDVLFATK